MAKAVKSKQLIFSLPNKVGLLSEVASAIAAANVNIEAVCAYERGYGYFMMVTDNNTKVKKVLSKMGAEVHVEDVLSVEVPNKVGQLEKVAKKSPKPALTFISSTEVRGREKRRPLS